MTTGDVLPPRPHPSPWLGDTLSNIATLDSEDWRLVIVIHGVDQGICEMVRASGLIPK